MVDIYNRVHLCIPKDEIIVFYFHKFAITSYIKLSLSEKSSQKPRVHSLNYSRRIPHRVCNARRVARRVSNYIELQLSAGMSLATIFISISHHFHKTELFQIHNGNM